MRIYVSDASSGLNQDPSSSSYNHNRKSNMKKLFLVMMVLYGAGTAAAQEPGPCKGGSLQWIEILADSIRITPEQRTQIDVIQTESCRKAEAALQAAGGNREQAKPLIQAIRKETHTAVVAVLTTEQRTRLAQMRGRKMDCAQRGAGHLQRMKDSLGLTEVQLAELHTIHTDACRRSQEAIAAAGGIREAAKAQLKTIRAESKAKTMAVLTPEQRERWKTMQARQRPQRSPDEHAAVLTERMKQKLQLNESQVSQVNALNLSLVNQRRALKEKEGQGVAETELKPLRQAMMRDYRNGLATILTPAQQETWRQARQERREGRGKPAQGKP